MAPKQLTAGALTDAGVGVWVCLSCDGVGIGSSKNPTMHDVGLVPTKCVPPKTFQCRKDGAKMQMF